MVCELDTLVCPLLILDILPYNYVYAVFVEGSFWVYLGGSHQSGVSYII